jgi:hypothetical protein
VEPEPANAEPEPERSLDQSAVHRGQSTQRCRLPSTAVPRRGTDRPTACPWLDIAAGPIGVHLALACELDILTSAHGPRQAGSRRGA